MGLWTGIKHAINSSLGTNDFKPLDKIIRDSYYVYASDDLLKTLYKKTYPESTYKVDLTDIGTINVSGVVRITVQANGLRINTNDCVYIGKNGNVQPIRIPNDADNASIDIEVSKGDVIQFKINGSASFGVYVNSIQITANGQIGSAPDTGIFIE